MRVVRGCAAAVGGATWLVIVALLRSLQANPDASAYELFISELAAMWRPGATLMNASFVIAGVALVVLALACGLPWARSRLERATVVGSTLTGALIALVGLFPLPAIEIHNPLAVALIITAHASAWLLVIALRRRRHPLANGALIVVGLQALCLAAAVVHLAQLALRMGPAAMLYHLDVVVGGRLVNPIALIEWLFFGLFCVLVLGAAAALTREHASRPMPLH